MIFNSYQYLIFLVAIVSLYWLISRKPLQNVLLLAASYFFYANWSARFLILIIISTVVDYIVGRALASTEREKYRRVLLFISVGVNLGILAYFKYFNFFIESAIDFLTGLGIQTNLTTLNIILPAGISFYTFQTMSYTIDIYRKKLEPTHNFLDFALFVSFFPQLVAGPIERAKQLLPQIESARRFNTKQFEEGLILLLLGIFKKLAIADVAASLIDPNAFVDADVNSLIMMQVLYLFGIQIYMDFSAYSDIARGSAKMLGIDLMENFNQPYFARNLSEYWRNWHISLTTWLRDYLYIPLRKIFDPIVGKNFSAYAIAVMITMFLSGLWHGANYTFVIWGLYLGFFQVVQRFVELRFPNEASGLRRWTRTGISIFVTFHFVTLGWLLFRTPSIVYVPNMIDALLQAPDWSLLTLYWPVLALFTVMFSLDFAQRHWCDHAFTLHLSAPLRVTCYVLMLLAINFFTVKPYVEFIYFRF